MNRPCHYYRFIEMRKGAPSTPWDGQERRAGYRQTDTRFARNPYTARDRKTIFRRMIVEEIKNGTLSPWRRKRIVRFAAKLGLSATQAGELLAECHERAMVELDAMKRAPALRAAVLPKNGSARRPAVFLAVAVAVLAYAVFVLLPG